MEGLDPINTKKTSLEKSFSSCKPIKNFMINKVRLLVLNLESTCYTFIQHQSCTMYLCTCICPTCNIHGGNLTTSKGYIGILDNNFNGLLHLIVYVHCHFLAHHTISMVFWKRLETQELKQRLEIFIIYNFTFIQEVENDGKLNKFLFVFHYLIKIKLLTRW